MTRFLPFFLALLLAASPLRADEPTVQAACIPSSAEVGETVRFTITITGGDDLERPPKFSVDGLDIHYAGPSSRWDLRFENGNITRTSIHSYQYQVTPQRAGEFTIPGQAVQVGTRRFMTQPAGLSVTPSGTTPTGGSRIGVSEIILPKKTAYVGEALPTELRLSVDSGIPSRVESMPAFEADSFTKTKFGDPRESNIVRNGRSYDIIAVRTVLTPTKAGKLTAGPAVFQYVAQIPRAQPRQANRFGNGLFEQLFNDPTRGFGQLQRYTATSEPAEITVKPLPIAGRPANFSGAVGHFTMTAQGKPARVKMGDPITMNLVVSGAGNFDRVNSPVLADAGGWRAYPPTATYKGDDSFGINGTKSFEIMVIPEEKKEAMPVYEFSFFDPTTEKYETLRSDAVPLQVEGSVPVATAPEVRGPTRETAAATPTPPPVVKPTDIVGIRYDLGPVDTVQPLYTQRAFLFAQLVPLGLLSGMVAVRFWPRDRAGRAHSALRRERAMLQSKLRRETARPAFFASAVRLLQVDTALRNGEPPETIDATEAGDVPVVREIFDNHAQSRFSGAEPSPAESLPEEERRRILEALNPLLTRK